MLQKIISFIKYHNAASIGISLALVLSFSAMASDDVRDAVLGEKIVKEQGADNGVLLAADLANFDLAMEITNAPPYIGTPDESQEDPPVDSPATPAIPTPAP